MRAWIAILWALGAGPVVAGLLKAPHGAWVAMLGYHLGCIGSAQIGRGSFGPRPPWPRSLVIALLSAVVVAGTGRFAYEAGLQGLTSRQWFQWGLQPPSDRGLLLYYLVANPYIEEWFWRGTILGNPVRHALGTARARVLAVMGFWPLHAVVLVPAFGFFHGGLLSIACLAAGALWTMFRERQGNIWDAFASHQGADAGVVWLYWVLLRGSHS